MAPTGSTVGVHRHFQSFVRLGQRFGNVVDLVQIEICAVVQRLLVLAVANNRTERLFGFIPPAKRRRNPRSLVRCGRTHPPGFSGALERQRGLALAPPAASLGHHLHTAA